MTRRRSRYGVKCRLTLVAGAATAGPIAATPQFWGAKDATALVLHRLRAQPQAGMAVGLTVDIGLQRVAEQALQFEVVSVTSLPDKRVLVRGKLNVEVVRSNLAFRVTIRNRGGSQQPATVSLRLSRAPMMGSLVKRLAVGKLGLQTTKTVTFTHLGMMAFAVKEKVVITVANTSGKTLSAAYPVIFALG